LSEEPKRTVANIAPPKTGTAIIAEGLVLQMGSSGKKLMKGEIDMRVLSNLSLTDQVALGHFNYRAKVDGNRYFAHLVDWILHTAVSIDGKRSDQVIDTIAASVGGARRQEYISKPGWIGRNITKRDYKEEAAQKGQTIID